MAAAATLAVIGGGAYTFLAANDPATTPNSTAITLTVPTGTGTSINSCVPFDMQYLRDMPVAFSGSATEVGEDSVTLEVDDRYLITATDGTVNFCGYSGPWNQERADAFDEASVRDGRVRHPTWAA